MFRSSNSCSHAGGLYTVRLQPGASAAKSLQGLAFAWAAWAARSSSPTRVFTKGLNGNCAWRVGWMSSIVVGASGIVGGHIVDRLVLAGEKPVAVSRTRRAEQNVDWLQADLATPDRSAWPPVSTLDCTAHVCLLVPCLP